jgi:GNAT superfamily N-acetyltransferase
MHTVRAATEADIPEIIRVTNRAYRAESFCIKGERTDADDIRALCEAGRFLVIDDAECPTRLLGSVYLKITGARGYLGMLAVDPDAQGRGFSRLLVAAVETQCRAGGCGFVDLTVVNLRDDLFSYYRKLGFLEGETMPFPVPERMLKPLHLVRMSKAISSHATNAVPAQWRSVCQNAPDDHHEKSAE